MTKLYKLYQKPSDRLKEVFSISKKKYGKDFYALNDVDFSIRKGETVGILGKNGAGKSTLLKIITGVLNPTEGNVVVDGTVSALLELGAGFNPEYTGMENIYLNGAMMGMSREDIEQKVDGIVSFADIGDFIYHTKFQIKCMDHMKKMMEGGTTVLFVSHDINAIRRFCKRAIWIHQGCVIEDGEVNRVADRYMDFLKMNELDYENTFAGKHRNNQAIAPFVGKDAIAEIVDFQVFDSHGTVGETILFDEPLKIQVTYDVYDTSIVSPVLGVAVRSADDDYTCGLNTLLDEFSIPWNYGRNQVVLEFPYGLRAAGGKYYFEAALEDQTATVAIHYIQRIKAFTMVMRYEFEGRYNIPHEWKTDLK